VVTGIRASTYTTAFAPSTAHATSAGFRVLYPLLRVDDSDDDFRLFASGLPPGILDCIPASRTSGCVAGCAERKLRRLEDEQALHHIPSGAIKR
jgi:hypothetical protein